MDEKKYRELENEYKSIPISNIKNDLSKVNFEQNNKNLRAKLSRKHGSILALTALTIIIILSGCITIPVLYYKGIFQNTDNNAKMRVYKPNEISYVIAKLPVDRGIMQPRDIEKCQIFAISDNDSAQCIGYKIEPIDDAYGFDKTVIYAFVDKCYIEDERFNNLNERINYGDIIISYKNASVAEQSNFCITFIKNEILYRIIVNDRDPLDIIKIMQNIFN